MKSSSALTLLLLLFSFANNTAQAQVVILNESFDTITVPDIPSTWIGGTGWSTSSSSASPGSGGNNVTHTGSGFGLLALPALDLTAYSGGFITYLARRTSSYDQANLILTASNDGGATYSFTVINSQQALPVATSTYQTITTPLPAGLFGRSGNILRFEALGGTSSGSNIRIDDLVITATLNNVDPPPGTDSTAQSSRFGFRDGSSNTGEQSSDVLIPLSLTAVTSLRGLQFDITVIGSNAQILGIERGPTLSDTTSWTVNSNIVQGSMRVIVLSTDSAVTMAGVYNDFLSIRVQTNAISGTSPIVEPILLSGVIGAMDSASISGDSLTVGIAQHNLTILPQQADFQADLSEVNFGAVAAESSAQRAIFISNPAGTTNLVISDVTSTNQRFSVARQSFTIPPGATDSLIVTFSPTQTSFGTQTTDIVVTHNGGPVSQSVIPAIGFGLGGRGDANMDGSVDVGDVLSGIDAVLGVRLLSADGQQSLDVYPEFAGDLSLDVRDLAILVEAILNRSWTDGIFLPEPPAEPLAFFAASALADAASHENGLRVQFEQLAASSFRIWIHVTETIRGLELEIPFVSQADLSSSVTPETNQILLVDNAGRQLKGMNSRLNPATGSLRILLALNFGNELLAGSYSLGMITLENDQRSPTISHAVAYDFNLNRIPVNYDITFTGLAYPAGDETPALSLKTPYPNPWQLSSSNEIRVPFDVPPSTLPPRFEVFDILGRKIKTPGANIYPTQWRWAPEADQLVPGLYFLRMETNDASYTTSFSVIR